ncbi:MAG: class I SAM-dependent methyltransferase [archaeon]
MSYDTHLTSKKAAMSYEKGLTDKKHYYLDLMHSEESRILRQEIEQLKIKKCLDFACGTGRITEIIDELCTDPRAIDISKEAITIAKTKCTKTKFYCGNYLQKAFPMQDLDAITSFRFLLNTPHREDAIKIFSKSIKKGGYLIFDIHRNLTSFRGAIVQLKHLFGKDQNKNTLSHYAVNNMLKKNGFKIRDYYGIGVLPHVGNFTIFPKKINTKLEQFITKNNLLRLLCFDVVYIAEKVS